MPDEFRKFARDAIGTAKGVGEERRKTALRESAAHRQHEVELNQMNNQSAERQASLRATPATGGGGFDSRLFDSLVRARSGGQGGSSGGGSQPNIFAQQPRLTDYHRQLQEAEKDHRFSNRYGSPKDIQQHGEGVLGDMQSRHNAAFGKGSVASPEQQEEAVREQYKAARDIAQRQKSAGPKYAGGLPQFLKENFGYDDAAIQGILDSGRPGTEYNAQQSLRGAAQGGQVDPVAQAMSDYHAVMGTQPPSGGTSPSSHGQGGGSTQIYKQNLEGGGFSLRDTPHQGQSADQPYYDNSGQPRGDARPPVDMRDPYWQQQQAELHSRQQAGLELGRQRAGFGTPPRGYDTDDSAASNDPFGTPSGSSFQNPPQVEPQVESVTPSHQPLSDRPPGNDPLTRTVKFLSERAEDRGDGQWKDPIRSLFKGEGRDPEPAQPTSDGSRPSPASIRTVKEQVEGIVESIAGKTPTSAGPHVDTISEDDSKKLRHALEALEKRGLTIDDLGLSDKQQELIEKALDDDRGAGTILGSRRSATPTGTVPADMKQEVRNFQLENPGAPLPPELRRHARHL